ncbi:hypothetical protein ACFY05_32110 [Microtetraspora fusca]|uniref:Uncharacterized protein n=1 Tax=Microtetraspora fusca TaxID=1997 RepID=A0ABW6VDT2_MICFU
MEARDYPTPPPSRHAGSRLVTKGPNLVRAVSAIRGAVATNGAKIRRQDLSFTVAAPASGVPCTSGSFVQTHVTMVYRSGHNLYADLGLGTGAASVMEARLTVPDLGLTGAAVTTAAGGADQDARVMIALPDAWAIGSAHRVYVEARRVSGSDATTVRVLAAWQR